MPGIGKKRAVYTENYPRGANKIFRRFPPLNF